MSFFNTLNFRRRIIFFGIIVILFTVVVTALVVIFEVRSYERDAETKINELTSTNLENVIQSTYHLVEAQHEAVLQQVAINLNVAQDLLNRAGMVTLGQGTQQWTATNQLTHESTEISLPKMYIGSSWVGHNTKPEEPSPMVDEIVALVGGTSTIFQRMDEAGNMLRVATTVQNTEGKRAVGTYIPVNNPDGTPNQVIATVMKGEIYHGRAFVVNAWYIATYRPLIDHHNTVIGMLYVGVKQESITEVRNAIQQTKVGETGKIYVLNSQKDALGQYIIFPDGTQDNQKVWDLQDADGGYPVQRMIEKALTLKPGEIATERYRWQEPGALAPRWKINQIAYFKPWDWVIISEVYEDEILAYRRSLAEGHNRLMRVISFTGLGIILVVGGLSSLFARSLTRPLDHLAGVATQIAAGDLSVSAQVRSKDEIGVLGKAFNEMTGRLRGMLRDEMAQRQRLESTVQAYVEHMQRVAQGDLQSRVALNGASGGQEGAAADPDAPAANARAVNNARAENIAGEENKEALWVLGEHLNTTTASLQRMIEQIHTAANELSTSASEILAVTIQQSSGANEQTAAIMETTSTVEMVKTVAEQSVLRVQEVADAAEHTLAVSRAGQEAVQNTVTNMTQIRGRVRDISMAVRDLQSQAQQIGQIINTVNDIAEQSNLLAINAAVEAARAGDAGKSFAVVASEVRSLAEQSRRATEQVRVLLGSVQKAILTTTAAAGEGETRVESGVLQAAQTGESIEKLAAVIQSSAQAAVQVAAGEQQQKAGIEQIMVAMESILEATTQSLSSTRQAEKSAQMLDELARKMAETVGQYKTGNGSMQTGTN